MDVNSVYALCFKAIEHNDIESFAKELYSFLDLPVMITSISNRLITACPSYIENDDIWNDICQRQGTPEEHIYHLLQQDVLEVSQSRSPLYIDDGLYASDNYIPRLAYILSLEEKKYGTILFLCPKERLTDEFYQITDILAKAAAIIISRRREVLSLNNFGESRSMYFCSFTRELFAGSFKSFHDIEKWNHRFKINIRPPFSVIAIQSLRPHDVAEDDSEISIIFYDIQKLLPLTPVRLIANNILVFIHQKQFSERFTRKLAAFLAEHSSVAGVSMEFSEIRDLANYIKQATIVATIARTKAMVSTAFPSITYFSEVIPEVLIHQYTDTGYAKSLAHPGISILKTYDEEHNTDYFSTLITYIHHFGNINEVPNILHIHRNTFFYRINKIKDIIGIREFDIATVIWLLFSETVESL